MRTRKVAAAAPEMVVLVGIPGSGKSTLVSSRFQKHTRVNLDSLRSRSREEAEIRRALSNGESVVVDNTNTMVESRRRYVALAREFGVTIRAVFLDCPIEIALERNSKRLGRENIPEKALWFYNHRLEVPTVDEGFQSVAHIHTSTQT